MQKRYRPIKIGVCGSYYKSDAKRKQYFEPFCKGIGQVLAKNSGCTMVLAGRSGEGNVSSADECFADGFKDASGGDLDRIHTFHHHNANPEEYFQIGQTIKLESKTREGRRYSMVHAVDALIGVGGTIGTSQQLMFAFATEKPVVPVPGLGGTSQDSWSDHKKKLQTDLSIKDLKKWENWTGPSAQDSPLEVADMMVNSLLASMKKRCFVIMPFAESYSALIDFVITPVVEAFGDEAIHLARRGEPGDVGNQIESGIRNSDYVICVLDGLRPNVMYELGIAHTYGKKVIILWNKTGADDIRVPFDIVQEQRIDYTAVDRSLEQRLKQAIQFAKA